MNQTTQNQQTAAKSNIPKIISGIAITILIIALGWFLIPTFWFWIAFEIFAGMLVASGCLGEWYLHHHPAGKKKREKDEHHKLESRYIAMVAVGVTMEFFVLAHSIQAGIDLENDVAVAQNESAEAKERSILAESNNLVSSEKLIELAHQYDLSTNALVEANARILSVSNAAAINSPREYPNFFCGWDRKFRISKAIFLGC